MVFILQIFAGYDYFQVPIAAAEEEVWTIQLKYQGTARNHTCFLQTNWLRRQ